MRLSAPIFTLKRQARHAARADGVPLHAALDAQARKEGFQSWSHLAARWSENSPVGGLLSRIRPGTLCVLAARPGQGKTMLGLELCVAAAKEGEHSHFMTLDYTEADVIALLRSLGMSPGDPGPRFHLDTSDRITAAHICGQIGPGAMVVMDYMQLLDQDRRTPPLGEQLAALRDAAGRAGARIVLISQVDRGFDLRARGMPGLDDLRLPNPVDLRLFDMACFVHEGQVELRAVA